MNLDREYLRRLRLYNDLQPRYARKTPPYRNYTSIVADIIPSEDFESDASFLVILYCESCGERLIIARAKAKEGTQLWKELKEDNEAGVTACIRTISDLHCLKMVKKIDFISNRFPHRWVNQVLCSKCNNGRAIVRKRKEKLKAYLISLVIDHTSGQSF